MNDRFIHLFHLRSYFGGCLELVSLDGWGLSFLSMNFYLFELKYDRPGTDVFVRLPKLVSTALLPLSEQTLIV